MILLGPPGAGKGTQARLLSERLGLPHLSSGDILRKEIEKDTDLGREVNQYARNGLLVPDDLIIRIMKQYLDLPVHHKGYILDGFPRTAQQAEKLKSIEPAIDAVLLIDINDEQLIRRMTGRRSCSKCWRMFHIDLNPPRSPNVCDDCGVELVIREDDREETVRKRLQVYHEKTQPLIEYYRNDPQIIFIHILPHEATATPDSVHSLVMNRLQKLLNV